MAPRELANLQRFVSDAVQRPSDVATGAGFAAEVESLIAPSVRGMSGTQRLDVYREQFWIRHLASLSDDYPTLTWVLGGAAAFRALAGEYLVARPPSTWDLQRLGADLPAFVHGHAGWKGDLLARDAAHLDWAFMEAFDAADAGPLDAHLVASTAEDAWPGARLGLHPSLRLLSLSHPVHELRDAVKNKTAVERPPMCDTHVVVWRDAACFLRVASVEPLAFELLAALCGGAALGEACEAVARVEGNAAHLGEHLGGWFQTWTSQGWVSSVQFNAQATGRPPAPGCRGEDGS